MTNPNKTTSSYNPIRQRLNLFFAVTQFFVPFFSRLTGIGQSIEAQAGKDITASPEVPASYAFGIWFILFILSMIYAVHQALPSQRENSLYKKIGGWTAALFFLSTLWMLIVQIFGDCWFLAAVIIFMLISTLKSFFGLRQSIQPLCGFNRIIMAPFLGLFSGWLSVAVFLNIADVFKASGLHTFGLSTNLFAILTMLPAFMLALGIIKKSDGNLWYGGTILWALAAVLVANIHTQNMFMVCVAAGLSFVVILALFYSRKHRSKNS